MSSTASDPAKAVLRLPLSTLRAAWPALGNPANLKKETPLTQKQFHWCFTNVLSRDESDAVYERYYIPGSARPFFQAGFANFNPSARTKVDYKNPARPPLLLVTGAEDRIRPPSVNLSNFKQLDPGEILSLAGGGANGRARLSC
jgi:hypothetical protein